MEHSGDKSIPEALGCQWISSKIDAVCAEVRGVYYGGGLQQPGLTNSDNSVSSGGLREYIPLMSKVGIVSNIDALFMEVHNNPSQAKCDGPTQIYLKDLNDLLDKITKFWSLYQTVSY